MYRQCLLNFAVSYSGGGLKRLSEYSRWFNEHGGAAFVIHPRSRDLVDAFPANRYFIVEQSSWQRLFNDCGYLKDIRQSMGPAALYYSYGIPIYERQGDVNWFHLSNVLPLVSAGIPLFLRDRPKLALLGRRIVRHYAQADVISAESMGSLDLIDRTYADRCFLSVNGSDDEIQFLQGGHSEVKENIAVVVGTQPHKALMDSYRVFEMLRQTHDGLRLLIVGSEGPVPAALRRRPGVSLTGNLPRQQVIATLRTARFYISTTRIENSYNAEAEGAVFADESYLSDLRPHQELLAGLQVERVTVPGVDAALLRVTREAMRQVSLKSWDQVVTDMVMRVAAVRAGAH